MAKSKTRRKKAGPRPGAAGPRMALAKMLARAIDLHRRGRRAPAEQLYRQILRALPEQPDALHFLGVLSHQQGAGQAAVELIERAIALAPDNAEAHNNLGNVLGEQGRFDEAVAAYRKVIALRPADPDGYSNLGVAFKNQGAPEQALAAYGQALDLVPEHAGALCNLANLLRKQGKLEQAISLHRRVVEVSPGNRDNYRQLYRCYHVMGRLDEAAEVCRLWLSHDPDNAVARHMLAACSQGAVPERASDRFVQQTFDDFAGSFDQVLKRLDYRAPELVAGALAEGPGAPDGRLDVLDAGCGTGLCGPLLRPYARRLVGVDLSPAMLAKAEGRGVYDELVCAELTAVLNAARAGFDLIASADTLCYFGGLGPVLAAARGALRAGGHLVFTLERAEPREAANGFRLLPQGRYGHTRDYLWRSLDAAGLRLSAMAAEILRTESKQPVAGLVVLARKPAQAESD